MSKRSYKAEEVGLIHYDYVEKQVLIYHVHYDPENIMGGVTEDMFDCLSNIAIFKAIQDLRANGKNVNVCSVCQRLDRGDIRNSMSFDEALFYFTNYDLAEIKDYQDNIGILRESSLKRKLVRLERSFIQGEIDVREYIAKCNAFSTEYQNYLNNSRFAEYDLPNTMEEMKRTISVGDENIATGYHFEHGEFELTIPVRGITLVVLPTSHGKSTMLNNLTVSIVRNTDINVLYLSLEEHRDRVCVNLLNCYCKTPLGKNNRLIIRKDIRGISTEKQLESTKYPAKEKRDYETFLKNPAIQAEYFEKKKEFVHLMEKEHRINIQSPNMDIDSLIEYITHMKRKYSIGIVMIDYVQLIQVAEQTKFYGRPAEIKYIMEKLRKFSNDEKNGIPVVLAAQFNREVVHVWDMALKNIGEGSNLEFYADTVIVGFFCSRNPKTDDPVEQEKINNAQGTEVYNQSSLVIRLDKGRSGQTGMMSLLPVSMNCGFIADEGCPLPEEIFGISYNVTPLRGKKVVTHNKNLMD